MHGALAELHTECIHFDFLLSIYSVFNYHLFDIFLIITRFITGYCLTRIDVLNTDKSGAFVYRNGPEVAEIPELNTGMDLNLCI